jgi:Flp pilus assembly protein TadB
VSALAAAGAVVAVLVALHPGRSAGRPLPGATREAPAARSGGLARLAGVLEGTGRALRGAAGRRPDRARDRLVGALAAGAVTALTVGPVPAGAAAALAALLVRARRLRRSRRSRPTAAIERDLPDLVDLLALAVGAGVSVPAALPAVAALAPPALRDDLVAAAAALAGGRPSDEVVVALGQRWGPPARPFVHALADHLRYGTPVLPALERVGVEARAARRRAAEVRARRLPVLLLLPLVLCTLPAFGLLTVAPLVAGTFDSLRGGHLEAPSSVAPS